MTVEHLEVLVEERSIAEALRILLPRLAAGLSFEIYPHQSKQDLLAKLPARLQGYASWLPANHRILVVVDRDDDDGLSLKKRLDDMTIAAGLGTRKKKRRGVVHVVNRIAIEELEAWFFGDWAAVRAAYPKVKETVAKQAEYRDSDAIAGGTWEAFERELQRGGYFTGGLRKIEAARAVAAQMDPERNGSASFRALADAVRSMVAA
jgi:hypothetical protein